MIYPENYEEIKDHERFHRPEKGCDMEHRPYKSDCSNWAEEYYCKTHGVLCSRTGWELGWYMGSRSDYDSLPVISNCSVCGVSIEGVRGKMFCDTCKEERRLIRVKEYQKRVLLKAKKDRLIAREERNRIREIKREIESSRTKGSIDRKLNDLMGYSNEYQKADYHERIKNYTYNQLIEESDRLIVKFLNKKYNKTTNNSNL